MTLSYNHLRNRDGFTLIELLVVIAIIALLATVGLTSYRSLNRKARDGRRQSDVQDVRSALEAYKTDVGSYPPDIGTMVGTNHIEQIPRDPSSNAPYPTYAPSAGGYTITAPLENGSTLTVSNPL